MGSFVVTSLERTMRLTLIVWAVALISTAYAADDAVERDGKVLPIFQVVRFPNDRCTGTTRNGTCFTAEECSAIGGTNEGSCASGFGVCCVATLSCGGSSSTNNSYIVQTSVTTLTSPCTYTICPCSTDICRIRYDFTTNILANQVLGTAIASAGGSLTDNGALGDCVSDSMSIASPGRLGSPIICGTNTGQHMVLDSTGVECQTVNFHIGASTTTSRSWDIYVTQYTCGQDDLAGSPGCLQWFTGTSGLVKSYGFDSTSFTTTTSSVSATHLQNQHYEVCFRREKGYCAICFTPYSSTAGASTYGVSGFTTDNAIAKSAKDTECTQDYLVIPQGNTAAISITTTPTASSARFCGRYLNPTTNTNSHVSVCSRIYPFTLGVYFNDNEECNAASGEADLCETDTIPGGITGFALNFVQQSC